MGNGACYSERMDFLSDVSAALQRAMFPGGSWTILLLLGGSFVMWFSGRFVSRIATPEKRAQKVTEQKRAIYSAPHEYAPVRVHDFRGLDTAYYDATQRWLESVGFRCFGDVENVSLSAVYPNMRTAVRDLASADGVVTASIWQIKMRGSLRVLSFFGLLKGDMRVVDFDTEFSDGTFLSTANNREFDSSSAIPGIERVQLPNSTPVEDVLVVHRRRLAELLTERPGVTPVFVRTAKDVRSAAARAHALKCAEHARSNFVDMEQFARLASEKAVDAKSADVRAMGQELARIRDDVS